MGLFDKFLGKKEAKQSSPPSVLPISEVKNDKEGFINIGKACFL